MDLIIVNKLWILIPPLNLKTKVFQIDNSGVDVDCNIHPGKDYTITQRSNIMEFHWKDPLQRNFALKVNPKNKHFLNQVKR